jgi:acetyl-CoA synthetase
MFEKYLSKTEFDSYEDFYSNFKLKIPQAFNFAWDVMDELADSTPNGKALVWCDEKGAYADFTYAALRELSNRAAVTLQKHGIGKGDPVMLILKRRWEYWPILLALHKIGAIAIPATHLLTTKDIVYRCSAADIAGIVCVDDEEVMLHVDEAEVILQTVAKSGGFRLKAFSASVHNAPDLDVVIRAGLKMGADAATGFLSAWTDVKAEMNAVSAAEVAAFKRPTGTAASKNSDIMLLYFTSGTTGMPKMVQHNFTYPLGHIVTAKYWHKDRPDGLHLTVADTGWAKAAWGKIYGQWLCRSTVFVYDYDRFVPSELLAVICKHRVTNFCAPPTIYRFFIKENLAAYDFSALEHCCVAGEPLNPEIYQQWLDATGLKLVEAYGQTELTVVLANWGWFEPRPSSMGKPAAGYTLDLLREDGTKCDMGEEGQLVLYTGAHGESAPAGMFGGYYRDEELTASVWHGGVYYTGDVAWRDEDGYYWFVGRADDVIKSSGYRIGPFEVESALIEHPAVLECAITGAPDAERGAVVKASIILAKGYAPSDSLVKELQNHVKKTTAPYKYPRIVEFVSTLPRTISGKIRRVEIRGSH